MNNFLITLFLCCTVSLFAQKSNHYISTSLSVPLYNHTYDIDFGGTITAEYQYIRKKNGFAIGLQMEYFKDYDTYTDDPKVLINACKLHRPRSFFSGFSPSFLYGSGEEIYTAIIPISYIHNIHTTKKTQTSIRVGMATNFQLFNQTLNKYPRIGDSCILIDPTPITSTYTRKNIELINIDAFINLTTAYQISIKIALTGALQYNYGVLLRERFYDSSRIYLSFGSRFRL